MPEYYHQHITDKSWQILQDFVRQFRFILIGGWSVYLYTHLLKSKDIDIVVSLEELGKLKSQFDIVKNDRLTKYEIHQGEVDVDIYVEHYSNPGIPAEDLRGVSVSLEGFQVPEIETLLLLKHNAWRERRGSAKGGKDEIDILSLMIRGVNAGEYSRLLEQYNRSDWLKDMGMLIQSRSNVSELGLNEHQYSRVKDRLLKSLGL